MRKKSSVYAMKKYLFSIFIVAMSFFLTASCSVDYTDIGVAERYGCFRITGSVAGGSDDGKQVMLSGIRVAVDFGDGNVQETFTKSGLYETEFYTAAYADPRVIKVTVSDVDGADNGLYETAVKEINISSPSGFADGDGRNFVGTKTIVLDFLLDRVGQ